MSQVSHRCPFLSYSRSYIVSNKLAVIDEVVQDFVRERLEIGGIDFLESSEHSIVSATRHYHSRYGAIVATVLQDLRLAEEFQGNVVNFERTVRSDVELLARSFQIMPSGVVKS